MPAEVVPGRFCASYYGSFSVEGSRGDIYEVSIGVSGSHCTCKAFQFAKGEKECKHTRQVWKEACMWNCQWHDGNDPVLLRPSHIHCPSLIDGDQCPNCGGPVAAVKISV